MGIMFVITGMSLSCALDLQMPFIEPFWNTNSDQCVAELEFIARDTQAIATIKLIGVYLRSRQERNLFYQR